MGDILIVGKDDKNCFEIEQAVRAQGFRGKLTFEQDIAKEWLTLRGFDALIIDSSISADYQQEMAELLWSKNQSAHLIVFDLGSQNGKQSQHVRLSGADYIYGSKGMAHLKRLLERIRNQKPVLKNDFRILVVEDLDSPRDIICFYLEGLGFSQIKGVASAKEAIAELTDSPQGYHCVLTDVRMPEMTGRDLIEYMRSDQKLKAMPIIVLTAIGTIENLVDCLKAGASGFLVKPPKKDDIVRELSRAFRIVAGGESPRLAQPEEADEMREALIQKGVA